MRLPKINALTVSAKTVRRVAECLLAEETETRKGLGALAEVSGATAGKIVRAFVDAGVVEEYPLLAEFGRRPGGIRLRDNFAAWGILRMEERGCSLITVSWKGDLLRKERFFYDDAMSPEENEARLRGRWHECKAELERRYFAMGFGMITRESGIPHWKEALLEGIGREVDFIDEERALTAKALAREGDGITTLHVRMERETRALFVMGNTWREMTVDTTVEKRGERLTEWLMNAARLILIDTVAAESRGRHEGEAERFLRRLSREWEKRSSRPMPKLLYSQPLTFAEAEAVHELNRILARKIGDAVGQAESSIAKTHKI